MVQPRADGREAARAATIALADAGVDARRDRLRQRPRVLDADRRRRRGAGDRDWPSGERAATRAGERHEGALRPSARRVGRDRGGDLRAGDPRRLGAGIGQPRRRRIRTSRRCCRACCATGRDGRLPTGAVHLVRVRRAERGARASGRWTDRPSIRRRRELPFRARGTRGACPARASWRHRPHPLDRRDRPRWRAGRSVGTRRAPRPRRPASGPRRSPPSGGTPSADASAPTPIPPIGTEAEKTVVYTLITRPRRPSGTASWIVALAVAAIVMPPAPTGTISSSESGYDEEKASRIEATPMQDRPERDPDRARRAGDDEREGRRERPDPGRGHEEPVAGRVARQHVLGERRDDHREVHPEGRRPARRSRPP